MWRPCLAFDHGDAVELVANWRDVAQLLKTYSPVIARLMAHHPASGFRVAVRAARNGALWGLAEWTRSKETGTLRESLVWTAEGCFPLPGGPPVRTALAA